MGDRALENRIRRIRELESQKKGLDEQITKLKDEIRADMLAKNTEEHRTKNFLIRFKSVFGSRFDSKRFKGDHPELYEEYLISGSTMRLTIT